ncbi:MAG: hypothetical protein ACRDG3_07410 [Tepidiformaceae bacterium]
MAIGIYIRPESMNAAQYDDIMARLSSAGQARPAGRSYHACFGTGTALAVFDVWDSQANFDKFGETLLPILAQVGVNMGQPIVEPLHNSVAP